MAGLEPSFRLIYWQLVPRVAMPPALKSKARKTLCLCPMLTQAETRSFPWDGCSLPQPCAPLHTQRSCRRRSCSCQHLSTLFLPSGPGTCHNLMSSLRWVCQASRCLFQFSTYVQIGAFFFLRRQIIYGILRKLFTQEGVKTLSTAQGGAG